jgi:hypothetical protein
MIYCNKPKRERFMQIWEKQKDNKIVIAIVIIIKTRCQK